MKSKLFLVTAFVLALTITTFADESFAKFYPENTALFMEFNNTTPANNEFHKTALAQIIDEPQTQKFLSHTKIKFAEIFQLAAIMTQGMKVDDLMSPFGNHIAFGVYTENNNANALLVAEFPKDINPLQQLAPMNPAGANASEFNFTYPVNPDNPVVFVSVKITGQMLLISLSNNENYLDTVSNAKLSSLSTSSNYLRADSQIGQNRLLTIYSSPKIIDVLNSVNATYSIGADLSVIATDQFNTAAFGVCIEEPAFVMRRYIKEPNQAYPYDLLSAPDLDHISLIPTDSSSALTLGVDLQAAINFLINTAIKSTPETMALNIEEHEEVRKLLMNDVNNYMEGIQEEFGVNPLNDIIANLDYQMTFFNPNTNQLPGLELFGFGSSTFVANIKNTADLSKSLETTIDALVVKLQDQSASKLEIQTDFGTIKGLALANAITPCYLIIDDILICSMNPSAIEYILNLSQAKKTLLYAPAFEELRSMIVTTAEQTGLSGDPVQVGFMKIDGISDLLNNTVALGSAVSGLIWSTQQAEQIRSVTGADLSFSPIPDPTVNPPAFLQYIADTFPLYLLPSKEVINKHMFDSWTASYITEENEFVNITYGPMPFDSSLLSKDFGNITKAASYGVFGASIAAYFDQIK